MFYLSANTAENEIKNSVEAKRKDRILSIVLSFKFYIKAPKILQSEIKGFYLFKLYKYF